MSEKKPKIDLKARLGKKTVAAPGGPAIPPPVGIPKPVAMQGGPPAPQIDPSDPYAAVDARQAVRPPEPQAIKVEMSDEVRAEHAKMQKRGFVVAGVLGVITFVIGLAFGQRTESAKGADKALLGAKELVREIEAANQIARELEEVLGAAAEKLGKATYPDQEISKLGAINIPFEGANLASKNIGRFQAALVTSLVAYANGAQAANEQKGKISRLLGGSQAAIQELLQQRSDPKVRWGVFIQQFPGGGPWANMQLLPEPFLVKSDKKVADKDGKEKAYEWPTEFSVREGSQTVTLKRYKSGDPTSGDPQMIPVAPQTESAVCPSTTLVRIRQELVEMQQVLKGDATPGAEKDGFTQLGDRVVEMLKKIGQPG